MSIDLIHSVGVGVGVRLGVGVGVGVGVLATVEDAAAVGCS